MATNTTKIHRYATNEKTAVTRNTLNLSILLVSSPGIDKIHIPVMHIRLKAAEPIMVPGPNAPALKSLKTTSIIESNISGALDPSAIKVKFATVPFHVLTSTRGQKKQGLPSTFLDYYGVSWEFQSLQTFSCKELKPLLAEQKPYKCQNDK
jgi:hypothetical protein